MTREEVAGHASCSPGVRAYAAASTIMQILAIDTASPAPGREPSRGRMRSSRRRCPRTAVRRRSSFRPSPACSRRPASGSPIASASRSARARDPSRASGSVSPRRGGSAAPPASRSRPSRRWSASPSPSARGERTAHRLRFSTLVAAKWWSSVSPSTWPARDPSRRRHAFPRSSVLASAAGDPLVALPAEIVEGALAPSVLPSTALALAVEPRPASRRQCADLRVIYSRPSAAEEKHGAA